MRRSLAVVVALASAVLSVAQTPEAILDLVNGRTVEELVRLANAQNGDLLAGRQLIEAAKGEALQAGLRANPRLEIGGMKGATGPMNSSMLGASLPLELYHRRDRRVDVARSLVDVSELQQAERERQLRLQVETKFGEILALYRDLRFTTQLLAVNREALRLTEARGRQGTAPTLDGDLLRVEVNRIEAMKSGVEMKVGVAMLELKSLAGLEPEDPLQLKGSLEFAPSVLTPAEAAAHVRDTRPDVLAARAMEAVAGAELKKAEAEGKLDATLSAAYQRADSGFGLRGLSEAGDLRRIQEVFHQLSVGVSIALPVRNRNQGAMAAAAAGVTAARRRRDYAELIARREIAAAFLARDKAREGLEIYRAGVLQQARKNLTVIRRVQELGRTQLLDVIAEQRRLIDVEMGYTEALSRYYQADVRLRIAASVN
ncbi:MAG: TolC family protein [Bryobacteraceae bacterium]